MKRIAQVSNGSIVNLDNVAILQPPDGEIGWVQMILVSGQHAKVRCMEGDWARICAALDSDAGLSELEELRERWARLHEGAEPDRRWNTNTLKRKIADREAELARGDAA